MTNYSNLPDSEISRLIAEKVMGWEEVPQTLRIGGWGIKIDDETWELKPDLDFCNDPVAVFGPGGVVEKMNERGMVLGLRQVWNADGTTLWQASFDSNQNQYYDTQQDSPTRAVCLAALAAVEKDK